jgi:formylglycine-generating enzyme required for sulfatase activity
MFTPLDPLPPERFPRRLVDLGFSADILAGTEVILPPLCEVPPGDFLMGSDPARDPQAYDDEQPQHRVSLGAFRMARYPVTVAEYACFGMPASALRGTGGSSSASYSTPL